MTASPPPLAASILIVEDDPVQLRLYSRALRGYRLTCVSSGSQAMEIVQARVPDLILLDHVLDGAERGLDFLPRLKTAAPHVPVIVISGSLNVKQQLAALSGPRAAHYALEKPVDIDELERTVEIALTECGMGEVVAHVPRRHRTQDRRRRIQARAGRRGTVHQLPRSARSDECLPHRPALGQRHVRHVPRLLDALDASARRESHRSQEQEPARELPELPRRAWHAVQAHAARGDQRRNVHPLPQAVLEVTR